MHTQQITSSPPDLTALHQHWILLCRLGNVGCVFHVDHGEKHPPPCPTCKAESNADAVLAKSVCLVKSRFDTLKPER